MKIAGKMIIKNLMPILALTILGWVCVPPAQLEAQQGNNAIYNASGSCCAASLSIFDASVFTGPNNTTDICSRIFGTLSSANYPAVGAVVDARGINSTNSVMTCPAGGYSPWTPLSSEDLALHISPR